MFKNFIGTKRPLAAVTWEKVARDFELKEVNAAEARREARAANDDDSSIRWGGPANFDTSEPPSRSIEIINPPPPDEQPGERTTKVYTELSRETQIVKVYNPADQSQFIQIERILSIKFQGPDAWDVEFRLDWTD